MPLHSRSTSLHAASGDAKQKAASGRNDEATVRSNDATLTIPQPVGGRKQETSPSRSIPRPSRLPRYGTPRMARDDGETSTKLVVAGLDGEGRSMTFRARPSPTRSPSKPSGWTEEPSEDDASNSGPSIHSATPSEVPTDHSDPEAIPRARREKYSKEELSRGTTGAESSPDGDSMLPPSTKSTVKTVPQRSQSLRVPSSRSTKPERTRTVKSRLPGIPSSKRTKSPPRTVSTASRPIVKEGARTSLKSSHVSSETAATERSATTDLKAKRVPPLSKSTTGQSAKHKRSTSHGSLLHKISSEASRSEEIVSTDQAPVVSKKPAFSTLQQHFSPKKTSRLPSHQALPPRVSTKQPGQDGSDMESIRAQVELLQLHLLHRSSERTTREWRQSARSKIERRFIEVQRYDEEVREVEQQGRESRNLRALRKWADEESRGLGVEEKVSSLSGSVQGILDLTEEGGTCASLQEVFALWVAQVRHVWTSREQADTDADDFEEDLAFVEALDDVWEGQAEASVRKLVALQRELRLLGSAEAGSSLQQVLSSCKALVDETLEEVRLMRAIQRSVVESERCWVKATLASIADGAEGKVDHAVRKGLWQA